MSEASTSAAPATPANPCPKCGAPIPPEAPQGLCPKCLLQQASFPTETGATTRHTRPAPPNRDELARAFPHLQILELIGQGGMGFVYKARQPKLDRLVALKILAQPLAEQTHFAERFTREGRTLAKLSHPNIVTIHDFGQAGPFFYLLMEYVDGVNLRQAMRAGAIDSAQALAVVPRICEALQYAHNEGVLHRDIKPDNILLDTRGRIKIADFGIAKLMAEAVAENPLTGSGASLGTPHYMAPEQIEKPNAVDHRADIYSLGVVFYEMLTGELPLGRFAAPSETSGNDPRLDEIVFQTLEKQPDRRPQSANEVKTRVETISAAPQSRTPNEGPVTFKMTRCSLTTPELLQRRFGPFFRFLHKGDLRLDSENLTFVPRGNWIVMPLRAITSLSLVEFPTSTVAGLPWQNAIQGLKLIAVTFTEKGIQHRFLIYPKPGRFIPPTERNRQAEEWFTAIQNAIKARTGRIPPSSQSDIEPLPSAPYQSQPFVLEALKAVFVMLVLLGAALAAMSAIYLFIRRTQAPPPANPVALSFPHENPLAVGPSRDLQISSLYVTNNSVLVLYTATEPAAGERFVPVVRYGNGLWGEADSAASAEEYYQSETGSNHVSLFYWGLPKTFDSGFEASAGVVAARARLGQSPVRIFTNWVEPIVELTNSASQVMSIGIRLQKSPISVPAGPIVATLSGFGSSIGASVKPGFAKAWGTLDVPAGFRLRSIGTIGNKMLPIKTQHHEDVFWADWTLPDNITEREAKSLSTTFPQTLKITYGEPTVLYSNKTQSGEILFIALEVGPLPNNETFIEPSHPSKPEGLATSLTKIFEFNSIIRDGRALLFQTKTDIKANEQFVPVLNYGDGNWSPQEPKRDESDTEFIWVNHPTNSEFKATFTLRLPASYSEDFDVMAAMQRARLAHLGHPEKIHSGDVLQLFAATNGFGQILSGGLRCTETPATTVSETAKATIRGGQVSCWARESGSLLNIDFQGDVPAGTRLDPTVECTGPSTLIPRLAMNPRSKAFRVQVENWRGASPILSLQKQVQKQIEIPLNHRIEIGRVTNFVENGTFTAPREIESIVTIYLALKTWPQSQTTSSAVIDPQTQTVTKTFEFNSVTNASNYIVLRTDTPMPPGQTLTALIEDSSGNTVRGISSLAIVHKGDETNTSSGLMWNPPEGAAADWIDSSLQQIKDSVLGRQFKISEGQTIRLFKFPTKRDGLEKFAAVRLDHAHPANPTPPASLQLRSVFPLQGGFILHFSGDVPNGCRLEAICEPRVNDAEGRLDASHIQGNYFYNAMWTFERFHSQNLGESLGATLTNQFNALKDAPILINPGESKTLFTVKTPNKEFRAVLKLATPNER